MSKLSGFVGGSQWDKTARKFKVKTLGKPDNGAVLFQINVSGKDADGNRVYGQSIQGKVNIKSGEEGQRVYGLINEGKLCEFEGFFVPNNWENSEGKEIKGNQFLVTDSTTFVEKGQTPAKKPAQEAEPEPEEEDDSNPWR